jgi:hypothetical protein
LMVVAMLLFHYKVQWDSPMWEPMVYMLIFGLGLGGCMQTLVLAVQNAVEPRDMGVATASATFFRQMGGTAGTAIFLSVLFSTVGNKIADAFKAAYQTPQFQAALQDPTVLDNPNNQPVLAMLKNPGSGGGSSSVLSDSSFIQKLDPRLAAPFKEGFADSMHLVFLLGAAVVAAAFLLVLFVKEVPLRQMSGLEAQAAAEAKKNGGTPESEPAESEDLFSAPGTGSHRGNPEAVPAAALSELSTATALLDRVDDGPVLTSNAGPGIHGYVRDGEGTPVPQAVVTLIDVGGRQLGRTVTVADGGFALSTPGPGTYVLIGSAGSRQPQAATVVVGNTAVVYDLTLSGVAGLAGEVRDEKGGGPVPGALVVATDVRGEVIATGAAGQDGGFAFSEMVPGSYTLAVSAEGHRPAAMPVEVASGAPNWYEVRLAPGARISGTVRSAKGLPVDDARVTLLDPAGNVIGTAITGDDGGYGFTDLDGGDYTVIASGYSPVATPLRIEGPGRTDFDVELGHDPVN